jgi:hypothetical protein
MLAEAERWVDQGYREGPNNDTVFGKWYGDNNEPWCDQYQSYCGAASGNGDVVGRFQYTPSHVNWFKSRGQWGSSPRVGALVFYDWNGDGLADHVGLVVAFDGSSITTYEGNTSSGVAGSQSNGDGAYKRTRPRNGTILGYGYPAYPADAPAPVKPAPAPVDPHPYRGRALVEGVHGSDVLEWQTHMADVRGWTIAKDGVYGPKSAAVAEAFQRDCNAHGWPLDVDRKVGEHTWYATFHRPVTRP